MMQNLNIPLDVGDAARQAARGALWQEAASGENPREGLRRAGIPLDKRVLVVIGFQGCLTHNFAELEQLAKRNEATLYVINGYPDTPDPNPQITVSGRPLEGTISNKLLTVRDVMDVANLLGLTARIGGQGIQTVISSGSLLFENGQVIQPQRAASNGVSHAPARAQ